MRVAVFLLAALVLASLPAPARAGSLTINYEITSGSLSNVPWPGGGPVLGGSMSLRYSAVGPSTICTSFPCEPTATLLTLSAFGSTQGAQLQAPAAFGLVQLFSASSGSLYGLNSHRWRTGPAFSNAPAFCVPGNCPVGPYSVLVTGQVFGFPSPSGFLFALSFSNNTPGPYYSSFAGAINVSGQEVSRQFVPEPRAGLLLAAGLLGLAGATALRQRRPRGPAASVLSRRER